MNSIFYNSFGGHILLRSSIFCQVYDMHLLNTYVMLQVENKRTLKVGTIIQISIKHIITF